MKCLEMCNKRLVLQGYGSVNETVFLITMKMFFLHKQ